MDENTAILRSILYRLKGGRFEELEFPGLAFLQMFRAVGKVGESQICRIGKSSEILFLKVESSKKDGNFYFVIPGIFCSCHFFKTCVIENGTDWVCKHLLLSTASNSTKSEISDISELLRHI